MQCYGHTELEITEPLTKRHLLDRVRKHAEANKGDVDLQIDWDSVDEYRIVSAVELHADGTKTTLIEGEDL